MGATERDGASNTPSVKVLCTFYLFFSLLSSFSFAERLVITLTLPKKEEEKNLQKIWVVSVIREGAEVFSSPAPRSTLYYKCPRDMFLAVREEKNGWLGVIMIDGSLGWIRKSDTKNIPNVSNVILYVPQNFNPKSVQLSNDITLEESIARTALGFLGVPYRWGGITSRGMDCSGFVQRVFALNGVRLPRSASEQAKVGKAVPLDRLWIGDRLYFADKNGRIDHTGIYIGNGLFIHSARSNGGVSIDNIYDPKWARILVGARRL